MHGKLCKGATSLDAWSCNKPPILEVECAHLNKLIRKQMQLEICDSL